MRPREDGTPAATRPRVDVGAVLTVWLVVFALENIVVGVGWNATQFAGSWEMAHARYYLTPIALAAALPLAALVVAMGRLVAARNERGASAIVGVLGAARRRSGSPADATCRARPSAWPSSSSSASPRP